MGLHEVGRDFFRVAADLADHDHGLGLGVTVEQVERVHEIRPDDRVAANPEGGRLPDAALGELVHGLIGQRARARHDAHAAFLVNVPRHDADLALSR